MSAFALGLVLISAVFHATWNLLAKRAAAKETESHANVDAMSAKVATADQTAPVPAAAELKVPEKKRLFPLMADTMTRASGLCVGIVSP